VELDVRRDESVESVCSDLEAAFSEGYTNGCKESRK